MIDPQIVTVDLGHKAYDILIGLDLIRNAGSYCLPLMKSRHAVIITDQTVAQYYLSPLQQSLEDKGILCHSLCLAAGETSKSFGTLETLLEGMLAIPCHRDTMVIALGGGVIGDIAGFAASICLRGMDFIQIPTTLLAQVDSSVGGKTAINARKGKNLIGSFHQPCLVLSDIDTLTTLSRREILAGYAEIVKYGCIDDPAFFEWLEQNGKAVIEGDPAARLRAIKHSCQSKAAIVGADEREAGKRALLNLGHTFAHPLEEKMGFGAALLHGEAVSIGMALAFGLSHYLGLCPQSEVDRLKAHLTSIGLPTNLPLLPHGQSWSCDDLIAAMGRDKKATSTHLTFILAYAIGKSFISTDVTIADLTGYLKNVL